MAPQHADECGLRSSLRLPVRRGLSCCWLKGGSGQARRWHQEAGDWRCRERWCAQEQVLREWCSRGCGTRSGLTAEPVE